MRAQTIFITIKQLSWILPLKLLNLQFMTVIVESSNTPEQLLKFFEFCGDVKSVDHISNNTYEIKFVNDIAEETALLLNNAELDGENIKVFNQKPESGTSTSNPLLDNTAIKDDGTSLKEKNTQIGKLHTDDSHLKTGDAKYDDINQESKPRYIIMAQLLSKGYKINDEIISKSIQLDNKHGISDKFKRFINDLDVRLGNLTDLKGSTVDDTINEEGKGSSLDKDKKLSNELTHQFNENYAEFKKSKYFNKLAQYYDVVNSKLNQDSEKFQDKASQNKYGIKINDFYKGLVNDVNNVHLEAKRLSELDQ